jgi:alkylation response protein AidB-like acyl-CoA dehydrogenase
MEFSLKEETKMLQSNAEKFFKEKCPSSFVKSMLQDERGYSPELWKEMADLGWLGLTYEEKFGGSGGDFFDLFILFEEMGKALFPSPFYASCFWAGFLIKECADEEIKNSLLPSILKGEKILTIGLRNEQGIYDHKNPTLKTQENKGHSYTLAGVRLFVPYAQVAEEVLVVAQVKNEGPTLFRVKKEREGLKHTFLNTITKEKTFALTLERVKVGQEDILGTLGKGADLVEKVMPKAVALKCAEMVGGLFRVLHMTVDYMKQRVQFGRPLGALQVVQHYCVDIATLLDTCRLIAYQAASLLSEGIPCPKEVAMAKAWCSDAYKRATQIAHQLHGGIGFTDEHDLHLYYKHAKACEMEFGDSWWHRQKVAEEMGL